MSPSVDPGIFLRICVRKVACPVLPIDCVGDPARALCGSWDRCRITSLFHLAANEGSKWPLRISIWREADTRSQLDPYVEHTETIRA